MLQCVRQPCATPDWSHCALYQIGRNLDLTLGLEDLLDRMLAAVLELTEARRGVVLLADGDPSQFQAAATCQAGDEVVEQAVRLSRQVAEGWQEQAVVLVGLQGGDDAAAGARPAGASAGFLRRLCLPLRMRGRLIGTMYLDHPDRDDCFPDSMSPFYAALADQVALVVENARLHAQLRQENLHLKEEVHDRYRFEALLGESPPMRRMKALLAKVIESPSPVLIVGESGTGKELVARAIHYEGPRQDKRFVAENCAALPESLLESELFGYARGAFTGATQAKQGLFEVADNGTLFLDEIADTSSAVQAKLLRALETGEIRRLGETAPRRVKVRVVAATSRDLLGEVAAGRFRPELYYRLSVLTVTLPPLRERREDIPLLAAHFLRGYANRTSKRLPGFAPEVTSALAAHSWPGNVRELRNEVDRMAALVDEGREIDADLLSEGLQESSSAMDVQRQESMPEALDRIKKAMIERALREAEGNRTRAAAQLGISRPNLQQVMRRLGIP